MPFKSPYLTFRLTGSVCACLLGLGSSFILLAGSSTGGKKAGRLTDGISFCKPQRWRQEESGGDVCGEKENRYLCGTTNIFIEGQYSRDAGLSLVF